MTDEKSTLNLPDQSPISQPIRDWELAQELYVQQLPYSAISQQTGIPVKELRNRAYLQRWALLVKVAQDEQLQRLAKQWGELVIQNLLKDASEWAKRKLPDQPRDMRDYESARLTHIQAARLMLGIEAREKQAADHDVLTVGAAQSGVQPEARRIKRVRIVRRGEVIDIPADDKAA